MKTNKNYNLNKKLQEAQNIINKIKKEEEGKFKIIKNKSEKYIYFSDFFYNIIASIIIFFVIKNLFLGFFKKKPFILALLLIIFVISSLYLTIKKYVNAVNKPDASI